MISRYGQCIIFNAKDDDKGRSNFQLCSVSPVGRKFETFSAKILSRYHQRVADGLTRLVLHHSPIDMSFFEIIAPLSNLRALELVSCRSIKSIAESSNVSSLESLEVHLCPLEPDGVTGLFLPKLRRLKLHSCYKLSNVSGISRETVASLEELYLENCNVSDETASEFVLASRRTFAFFTFRVHELIQLSHIFQRKFAAQSLAHCTCVRPLFALRLYVIWPPLCKVSLNFSHLMVAPSWRVLNRSADCSSSGFWMSQAPTTVDYIS
ncbi:hypothetical protein ERJ75_000108300 [Trypanosoma vivax]|nr:hypothetical protein ERJ75_000108300 [Trypanosoma vivax]